MDNYRTDLAIEARELASANAGELAGVLSDTMTLKDINISRVEIISSDGEAAMQKPQGKYITIDLPKEFNHDNDLFERCSFVISNELGRLINLNDNDAVLVAGLGNVNITPDSLGPVCIENIMVTRHMQEKNPEWFSHGGIRPVAAIAPGVLGQTGTQSKEIIQGICDRIKPACVIVIDALASRRISRLASTVQISDTGINPGSGTSANRTEISKKTLGIPVISIGVPTVVEAATLACDVIDIVSEKGIKDGHRDISASLMKSFSRKDKLELLKETLEPYKLNLIVTPSDMDIIVSNIARLIGFSINSTLHRGVSFEEMTRYVG